MSLSLPAAKQDIINSTTCLFLSLSIAVLFSCSVSAVKQQDALKGEIVRLVRGGDLKENFATTG
jgi:hypothetical protein